MQARSTSVKMSFVAASLCRHSRPLLSHLSGSVVGLRSFHSAIPLTAKKIIEEMGLPKVFFDMEVDGQPAGRIVMEVSFSINTYTGYCSLPKHRGPPIIFIFY